MHQKPLSHSKSLTPSQDGRARTPLTVKLRTLTDVSLPPSGESVEKSAAPSEHLKKSPLSPKSLTQSPGLRSPSKLLHHTGSTGGISGHTGPKSETFQLAFVLIQAQAARTPTSGRWRMSCTTSDTSTQCWRPTLTFSEST